MTSNRRYPGAAERHRRNADAELGVLDAPWSLPEDLAVAAGGPLRRTDRPVQVAAYVQLADRVVQVEGVASRWNGRCIEVLWVGVGEAKRSAILWAGAVRRLEPPVAS